jgi:hypothetical protein
MAETSDYFSSTPPPAEGEEPKTTDWDNYQAVIEGLRLHEHTACRLYARAVKLHIISEILNTGCLPSMKLSEQEVEDAHSFFAAHLTTALKLPFDCATLRTEHDEPSAAAWAEFKNTAVALLLAQTGVVVQRILSTIKPGDCLYLVGSARTDVTIIGPSLYSFFVKQKWALTPL